MTQPAETLYAGSESVGRRGAPKLAPDHPTVRAMARSGTCSVRMFQEVAAAF